MILDDEIKNKISVLSFSTEIIDDWEPLAAKLSGKFNWIGSKIDWSKAINHQTGILKGSYAEWILNIKAFMSNNGIYDVIKRSQKIYYINDSSLDFSISFLEKNFNNFLDFALENIPQHHYFFDFDINWCLMISSEGYVDFGFARK